ncbi:hypothetical protein ACQP2U_17110 [Nocardia sp. CA-084685]|uniref:hypothetical protein n=1 Tax=Nocardia sp. CA-084685 TaxID=3239970 RepID=UPI003D978F8C
MSSSATPPHRKVAIATLVGTTLEWYDFMLYGTASALIFSKQRRLDLGSRDLLHRRRLRVEHDQHGGTHPDATEPDS